MTPELKAQFLLEQFKALRQEEEASKERSFRVYAIGVLAVPALSQVIKYFNPENLIWIKFIFPFFILAIMLLYLAENINIKRCGAYIREELETHFGVNGWETWLKHQQDVLKKHKHQYAALSFHVIFMLYYVCTCIVEIASLSDKGIFRWVVLLVYLLVGGAVHCYFYHGIYDYETKDDQCPVYTTIFKNFLNWEWLKQNIFSNLPFKPDLNLSYIRTKAHLKMYIDMV